MIIIWLGKIRSFDDNLLENRRLVILLPVFQETALIKQTIQYIEESIKGLRNISVYIVGNSKERGLDNYNPTLEIARNMIVDKSVFHVMEYEKSNGMMAHQINFCINQIAQNMSSNSDTWIYIINIDSRFSVEGLKAIITSINRNTQIIQQSAIFLSNYDKINILAKGAALYQSRWTISHEIKRFWLRKVSSYFLIHVVGHGLCINLDKFMKYHGLPEDTITEDLQFGFFLAAAGEEVESLPILELADSPARLSDVLKQKYVWSFGPMLYPQYLQNYRRNFPDKYKSNPLRAIMITIQGVTNHINWLTSTWIILYLIYIAPISVLSITFLTLYLLEYIQCLLFFYKRSNIKLGDILLAPILIVTNLIVHSLAANKALLDFICKREIIKYKTNHED